MSGFSADWLDLREALDAQSRPAGLVASMIEWAGADSQRPPLSIIDLGAGTGANLRYAAPRLGGSQHWVLIEHDPALLAALAMRWPTGSLRGAGFECRIQTRAWDLATQLECLPLQRGSILTASALLDLVSEEWLRALLRHARAAAATVWFALTYDGRIDCHPAEAEDQEVQDLFNRHQRGDKGFGAALGPAAAPLAEQLLTQNGYQVDCAPSDWRIGPDRPALQLALLEGWFQAACEMAPARGPALRDWLARRRAHVSDARSKLQVGHLDLIGRPQPDSA